MDPIIDKYCHELSEDDKDLMRELIDVKIGKNTLRQAIQTLRSTRPPEYRRMIGWIIQGHLRGARIARMLATKKAQEGSPN